MAISIYRSSCPALCRASTSFLTRPENKGVDGRGEPGHDGERRIMPEKVLIYSRFPKALMVRIGQRFELMDAAGKPPAEVFAAEKLSDVRALITAGGQPLGAAVLDTLPSLRAIICYGTGYDGVDLAAAASRKIAVGNSPGANAAAVADLAVPGPAPPAQPRVRVCAFCPSCVRYSGVVSFYRSRSSLFLFPLFILLT